jgi:hypothetical protein
MSPPVAYAGGKTSTDDEKAASNPYKFLSPRLGGQFAKVGILLASKR